MNEPKDEFYIDEQAAASTPAVAETPQEAFIDTVTKPENEHELIVLDADAVESVYEEDAAFKLIAEATPKPKDRILLFAEFSELYRRVVDAVESGSNMGMEKVKRRAKQAVIGTMIALGLGGTTKPAEAFDWKSAVQTGVSIAGRIGAQHYEKKAQEHAKEAEFLQEAPARIKKLKAEIAQWDGMITEAMKQLDAATKAEQKEEIQGDISDMRFARAECIHELEWVLRRLEKASKEGRSAESEMQKAQREAAKAEVADAIRQEAEWAHINWGWNTPF